MTNNTSTKKQPHFILSLIAAAMLLLALAELPYGYYQLLRFVVCGVGVYIAFTAYQWQRMWAVWVFGFIALLFNPLVPIYLLRELWQPVDVACAILFIYATATFKKPPQRGREEPSEKESRE